MPSFSSYTVLPVQYNSKCISFADWITLFTLCFTPLVVHIASGTPSISYLSASRPKWYDRICLYNPTSILWRYAAIADRRIRATSWDRNGLAATNAIFWTSAGWNCNEEMVHAALPFLGRLPKHVCVQILSRSMAMTIVTMLQGANALYALIAALAGSPTDTFHRSVGLDKVFFPLTILGLLRLCAATWLTDDFDYIALYEKLQKPNRTKSVNMRLHVDQIPLRAAQADLDPFLLAAPDSVALFIRPNSSWLSFLFRIIYLCTVGGACIMSLVFTFPMPWDGNLDEWNYHPTSFLVGIFYCFFTASSFIIFAIYFFRDRTRSTLLPCLSCTWYRAYTTLMFSLVVTIVIIASIETTKLPTGIYASIPTSLHLDCDAQKTWSILSPGSDNFGIVSRKEPNAGGFRNAPSMKVEEIETENGVGNVFWVYNVTAYCVGAFPKDS